MMKKKVFSLFSVFLLISFLAAPAVVAQKEAAGGGSPRAEQATLDLAVLVDDSLESSVSLQLEDVKAFIRELPVTTRVAVAYGSNGVAFMRQEFTTDHERAAAALRIPRGGSSDVSGLWDSVVDLQKRWPADGNRRAVLLVSSGIDLLRGFRDTTPGSNPDLQRAVDRYTREGITVYAIYASNASGISRNSFLVQNGQGSLMRLAKETGGEAYFSGSLTPVNFRPFLEDIHSKLMG